MAPQHKKIYQLLGVRQWQLKNKWMLWKGRKELFYLTTHSTHFIYGYIASDIWQKTIQIAREETRCRHMGYSFRLAARVLLYASSHREDNTYHSLCYTSRGALAGTRNIWILWEGVYMLTFVICSLKTCVSGFSVQALVTNWNIY